jgi:hypothetical protein
LGTVTHADRAHLGQVEASVGSTIYDGDNLSTGFDGSLRITARTVTLQLAAESSLTVRQPPRLDGGISAELAAGILIFAAAPNANVSVAADDASIRPAANASIVTYVRVVNQRELRISTQRGAVEFSYRGEREVIPEGKTLRVLLDPSEKEAAAASESSQDGKGLTKRRRTFLLLGMAMIPAVLVPVIIHLFESPDRPGSKPVPAFSKTP